MWKLIFIDLKKKVKFWKCRSLIRCNIITKFPFHSIRTEMLILAFRQVLDLLTGWILLPRDMSVVIFWMQVFQGIALGMTELLILCVQVTGMSRLSSQCQKKRMPFMWPWLVLLECLPMGKTPKLKSQISTLSLTSYWTLNEYMELSGFSDFWLWPVHLY